MDTQRFSKIRTLKDIKLEKARLRLETFALETSLNENLRAIRSVGSIPGFFSRMSYGFELGQRIYQKIYDWIILFKSWRKKKKKKKNNPSPAYDSPVEQSL